MHRIDTPTAQVDKFGAGKNGFTGGNPQTGELATALDADFFDSVQEEIAAVIEAAGLSLDKSSNKQLLAAIQKSVGPGRLLNIKIFTSSGVYTPTAGTKKIIVEVQGGGGAGGGSSATTTGNASVGGGGTEGCYGKALLTATESSYTIVVGKGGSGVAGASGNAGGQSSFGTILTADGGYGGGILAAGSVALMVAADATTQPSTPTVSGANIESSITGRSTSIAIRLSSTSQASSFNGLGGSSKFGAGGGSRSTNGAGFAASSYGSGGSGAKSWQASASDVAYAGGAGKDGIVIIWEYA
ncbi:carbohydrate kinase [Erwinia pyri]|uniref:Carbohydrate kinase n=1 Tax=Erwinia pyri TaxID=3062598 RepID=A0AA50DFA0_9GAMM|nr:carbohydrate kinase [Erwinia sp. DE2]WLS77201.1 carbohydrate kinase [Erwinia sp. DE2]